jgi:hypothetical protein
VRRQALIIAALAAALVLVSTHRGSGTPAAERGRYGAILQALVQKQDSATLHGDVRALHGLYLPHGAQTESMLAKARDRLLYIADWARARSIRFERVVVRVRVDALSVRQPGRIALTAADSARYEYRHEVGDRAPVWFGLGVYHHYGIEERDRHWYIAADNFIDPLNQDTRLGGAAHPAIVRVGNGHQLRGPLNAGAASALRYAQEYCGAAPGCGNDNRYNQKYGNYVWSGGDCTNFISQVLHAGGFRGTPLWHWDAASDEGSADWVNAPHLVDFLEETHRVSLIARGSMAELLAPAKDGVTPLSELRPGDIIAYWERGRVVHMAVVVGYDPDGYPLVVSHSADRFREPWDLGWDRTTHYLFLRVHYPDRQPNG